MAIEGLKQKTICLVADCYWPSIGGIERWAHSITLFLSKQYEVIVIAHSPNAPFSPFSLQFVFGKPFQSYSDEAGNQVTPLKPSFIGRLLLPALLAWNLPLVRRLFPKRLFDSLYVIYKCAYIRYLLHMFGDVDLVHCFSTGYLGMCAAEACQRKKIPFIHSPAVHFNKWGDSPLLLQSYARANAIICLSESFKIEFNRRVPNTKVPIFVIPAPVFRSHDEKQPDFSVNAPFILFLGRRENHKGLLLLLSAFKKLSHKPTLIIAGPGSPLVGPIDACVVDAGVVDEPVKNWLLNRCAIFCLPSVDESFGIVYVEAMMHKKPIVACDVAPVNEIVMNNRTGILVPPGRDDLLAQALDRLLSDPEKRRIMGDKGYQRYCELYEGNKVMERIIEVYRNTPRP
jgi:glycosyltransferase involved in cell wall biosynthesis